MGYWKKLEVPWWQQPFFGLLGGTIEVWTEGDPPAGVEVINKPSPAESGIKMPKKMSIPFKGEFKHSQGFGARPEVYSKFGLMGHDGDDWLMPEGTPLYSPLTGVAKWVGNDPNGWGNYVQIFDYSQRLIVNIAHLSRTDVFVMQGVSAGQQIGLSGSTGFSEAPHVHVAAADTDSSGNKTNTNNGYKGWYSILDTSKIEGVPLPEVAPTPTPTPTGTTPTSAWPVSFETAFPIIYPGWEKVAARADFALYGEKKWKEYLASQVPAVEQPRPEELKKKYFLIPSLAGLSLNQINAGVPLGRVDVLSGFLGLSPDTKLTAGQEFNIMNFPTSYFPSSSEWEGFKKLVGLTPIGNAGDYFLLPQYAGKSLNQINQENNSILGRADVIASFFGIPQDYIIPGYQGFSISGFPAAYIPNSSEWQGFIKVFQKGSPSQPKPPEEIPQAPVIIPKEPTITVSSSPPRGKFYIDELYFNDLTPSNKPYPVTVGTHIVRVEKSGYKPREVSVVVAENEQKQVGLAMEPITALAEPAPAPVTGVKPTLATLNTRLARVEKALTEAGILK